MEAHFTTFELILYMLLFKLICVAILIIMYCISSCNPIYFLKFVVHKINLEIVKSGMLMLIEREY
jgi:hypothetical protein